MRWPALQFFWWGGQKSDYLNAIISNLRGDISADNTHNGAKELADAKKKQSQPNKNNQPVKQKTKKGVKPALTDQLKKLAHQSSEKGLNYGI